MVKRSDCKCPCHTLGGLHIRACCEEDTEDELLEKLGRALFDAENMVDPEPEEWETIEERRRGHYRLMAEKFLFFNTDLVRLYLGRTQPVRTWPVVPPESVFSTPKSGGSIVIENCRTVPGGS